MESDKILDDDYNRVVGIVLKEKRISNGQSLSTLAKKLKGKVTRQALARYENNTARIKLNLFCDICSLYDIKPKELIEEITNKYLEYIRTK